MALVIISNAGH